jgi:hypothetical protein
MAIQTLPPAQLHILENLYRFRFLTSHQIHQLLKSKSPRLTNYHLNQLVKKKYISKHFSRSLGFGNQPATYYLATGSVKHFENLGGFEKRALNRIPKERYRSKQFISRASFITSFYLYLEDDSEKTNYKLYFFTKTELLAHPYFIHPLPDAYVARIDEAGNTKRYMVELIDDSSPRFALRRRIEQYDEYIDSGDFEAATSHDFPTILLICPGYASLMYLKKHLERIYEETSLDQTQVYLATTENALNGIWDTIETDEDEGDY